MTSPGEETPDGEWMMRSFSQNDQDPVDVRDNAFTMNINGTDIQGRICNGFGGDIEYISASTIKGRQVLFTEMLCTGPDGQLKMDVEGVFQDGLTNGMSISQSSNALTLRDVITGTTFIYERQTRSV